MPNNVVGPFPTQAMAFMGNDDVSHVFSFNPDQAQWSYKENIISQDTIGGRVVQILSVQMGSLSLKGRAGSRAELQRMASNMKSIMEYHVRTSRPVTFRVPSRQWNFKVYLTAMPQMGWDVAATSYPYQLEMAIEHDLNGVQSKKLEKEALRRLASGIGYDERVHGGDPAGFAELIQTLLSVSPPTIGIGPDDGSVPPPDGSNESNVEMGERMAAAMGWTGNLWNNLYSLWQRESSWSNTARNPSSGAYGIPQALPYTKMPKLAWPPPEGQADAATQIQWGLNYIKDRYGDPSGAWAHSEQYGWY